MASVLNLDIGIKHVDSGHHLGHTFVIYDRAQAKEAIWAWVLEAINELELKAMPEGREIVRTP